MSVHPVAIQGFAEGTNEIYDRARPSYRPSVLSHIRKSIPLERSSPLNIVEIGSGTGIFTRALLAHSEWKDDIKEIRAVDPSKGMRNHFEKSVIEQFNHGETEVPVKITVAEGTFTSTGIEDGWADMIVMAQAYHWAHPDYSSAQIEFHRILKPSGVVAYVWNHEDPVAAEWIASLHRMYDRYDGDVPQSRHEWWRVTFDTKETPVYREFFEDPVEETFKWVIPTTEDKVAERVRSKSFVAIMEREDKEEYEKLMKEVREMLGKKEKTWIDVQKGAFEYPYETIVITSRKKGNV
ncbi:hypothetical protein GYMLUDRAFT_42026 [Collybiopsis luxurians FD-317 M1]|uniref:Methyltransferase type 11 domain-containing protein n=1 Tax=Collybiopsis luxurians FD-317 M1 TaxID=944289 RepID=A0A0D0CIR3_9AGAR|nr:hypothetical protein GYMLUDRAFT_42026 [Collybiopsis luxurians FD-317 M1]